MPLRRDFLKAGASVLGAYAAPPQLEKLSPPIQRRGGVHVDNVILIVTDSMRRDALSPYRSGWIPTPHFDSFSQKSILFENADGVVAVQPV